MAQEMVWLSPLVTYSQAVEIFERIGHQVVARSSIWQRVQEEGERLHQAAQKQQERVSPERVKLSSTGQDHNQVKGMGMDGGMVNIRGEGWKEIKVGAVYDVETRLERDLHTQELVEQAHGIHVTYTAVLGSPEDFAPALWRLAVQQHVPEASDSCVTSDGAAWIWNLAADLFPDSVQIVDWFHACQHLDEAAKVLFPDDPSAASRWFRQHQSSLFQGHLQAITTPLEQAGFASLAHYFHTHQRRMQYQEFSERPYPIGSGCVESGVKQFKSRLTGPGMRWSRPNAQRMLTLRSAVMSHSFDQLWLAA
jgi:hypothetical protein